jgi:hypothetical protein
MTLPESCQLADLRGLRTSPSLNPAQRHSLQAELRQRVAACDWCTIGVMAPGSEAAWEALRSFEHGLHWPPLPAPSEAESTELGVFLKAHQRKGEVWWRAEEGLGEGVLITGHSDSNPDLEDTWGPLPLDFFSPQAPGGP